jgi:phospholipid:diacylglycerol acyltransferase
MVTGLSFLMERYLSKAMRAAVIRTWGSMMAMLPVGGTRVWGDASGAPDDTPNVTDAGRTLG